MRFRAHFTSLAISVALLGGAATPCLAADVLVAVATNFVSVAERIGPGFEEATGHDLRLVSGSTGKLFAQIVHGAPFDVFLAADAARPARLLREGRAVSGSLRTYAVGRLVLWRPGPGFRTEHARSVLRAPTFRRLAIANPDLAPYGAAAKQVLDRLSPRGELADRIAMGENVGQAFALVATGNAELGLIAASQLRELPDEGRDETWLVPGRLHDPIRQDAVLLSQAEHHPAARAFLDYLVSPVVQQRIRDYGYDVAPVREIELAAPHEDPVAGEGQSGGSVGPPRRDEQVDRVD